MNAYELADELDKYKGIATRDASTMLRQQAKRIEELESKFDHFESWEEGYQACKNDMNNQEPVAWMEVTKDGGFTQYRVWQEPVSKKSIPLYTHPHKELKEVDIVMMYYSPKYRYEDGHLNYIEFTKAIIKASRGEE